MEGGWWGVRGREGEEEKRKEKKEREEIRITIPSRSPRATVSISRPALVHGAPKGTRRVKPCALRLTDVSPSTSPMHKCQGSKGSTRRGGDPTQHGNTH